MDLKMDLNFKSAAKTSFDKKAVYDVLIVGLGPAGLSAALYAKRKGLMVGIIALKKGGQVVDTTSVENYLGMSFETGQDMAEKFMQHVIALDVPMLTDTEVKSFEKNGHLFHVALTTGETLQSKTLILATGSKPRRLGVVGEEKYIGRGVCYCAICDGPLFEGLDVIVAGGGNSAVEAAIDLAKIASSVTLVHRSQLRADQIVIDQMNKQANIKVLLQTEIQEVIGDQLVSGVVALDKATGEKITVPAHGIFVEIGYLPNSQWVQGLVECNGHGEIIINKHNETSLKGVFAAGDVTDTPYKQIIVAASEGAKAALSANDYINRA